MDNGPEVITPKDTGPSVLADIHVLITLGGTGLMVIGPTMDHTTVGFQVTGRGLAEPKRSRRLLDDRKFPSSLQGLIF